MSSDPQKCIVDSFGGHTHPYAYCVKPLEQMIDYNRLRGAHSRNMTALEVYAAGAINYAAGLVSDPTNALANECRNKLGNKYFLKTNSVCSNGETLHKYINNMDFFNIITQRRSTGRDGIIPAAIGSVTKINALGIFEAITGESIPECVKVKAPCHIIHTPPDQHNNYTGDSPEIWISKKDFNRLADSQTNITKLEGFNNQTIKKIDNINNEISNFDNNEFSKDIISNMYILSITLFLLFITYKLMHKK
tara:strand:+ start:109 stop:855 length:747 start_codon:yes stop_codon:yes gene_type:complete